jgi:predicted HAD superfamily phosphohydrolase
MSASSLPLPQGKSVSLKQFVSRHINEIGLRKRQTRYALLTGDSVRVPNVSAHLLLEKLIISSGFTGEDCAG